MEANESRLLGAGFLMGAGLFTIFAAWTARRLPDLAGTWPKFGMGALLLAFGLFQFFTMRKKSLPPTMKEVS